MSVVERVMLIMAVLMPIVALIMFLPKIIKIKHNKKSAKPKEIKQEQAEQPTKQPQPEVATVNPKRSTLGRANDFLDYAENKNRRISAPKRNSPSLNFPNFENFAPRPTNVNVQSKTLAEEIKGLSPELKALILSGALDRKDFDE